MLQTLSQEFEAFFCFVILKVNIKNPFSNRFIYSLLSFSTFGTTNDMDISGLSNGAYPTNVKL
jgi:hypothetical protein